ncbi:GNAT family N-acetyltransferase [Chitinophaga arvensicola]|uniref:Acetyltransferase (GNAT) domain-containing protein n=1 Tax=Chitinophaga arvensicola TaxID=29529 RepID=A0A1I0S984_9BACT|nr:GNAT family N-acetyltransferase [Chitinophaga arvensicola]SEW52740.1 Acetyltransferase (GNAT) domain-containing protein [Chitinophaga arvensicola]
MIFREATIDDIPEMQVVRNSVKENILSNPALISPADYTSFITVRGKGWVCEMEGHIVGFSVVDLQEDNVWALFLLPAAEGRGVGKQLQALMLRWYFSQDKDRIWLGTSPDTRAAAFYRKSGWIENGKNGEKEIRFEMTRERWNTISGTV